MFMIHMSAFEVAMLVAGLYELKVCMCKRAFLLETTLIGGCTLLLGACIDYIGYGR